ncbi:MAG: GSCFA domain-containing protein [Bacteroidales bacterium]|nr:GSCFA domain-containing protein [Bacteroidales bacterium]
MQLTTPVTTDSQGLVLDHSTPLLALGSCFADEMGSRLRRDGFDILCNPFGTLYNPLSIAEDLQMALAGEPLDPALLVQHDGLWHSWMHHSRFSSPDRDECLGRCNQAIQEAHDQLQRHPLLIVTFGTAWVFRHEGRVVANCHKIPPQQFTRTRLTIDEIVDVWQPLTERLHGEGIQTIFTVSPVRHLADTAHGNQLSKSTLLLAVDRIDTPYFDSYEILLDELRDYRFFGRDLCHPSDLAADIVYERFLDTYTTPATRQQALLFRKEALRAGHRTIVETKN